MEGNLEKTLGKECEVAKVMRFLKEINVYEDIQKQEREQDLIARVDFGPG